MVTSIIISRVEIDDPGMPSKAAVVWDLKTYKAPNIFRITPKMLRETGEYVSPVIDKVLLN